jgi:CRISPR-associated endonuclease Csn1
MKKILGLDLGTNSIGWALVQQDFENKEGNILGMGSRIIPMSQDVLSDFGKGNSVSQTAKRTEYRGKRRLRERHLLRRERLHRVLKVLGFLPEHYAAEIDFEKKLGKFIGDKEPKLVYNKSEFLFKESFNEMIADFSQLQPHVLTNEKGGQKLVPYDWTIYYLRKKALSQKIKKEELAWILLNFNGKRGYYQLRSIDEEFTEDDTIQVLTLKVLDVEKGEKDKRYNKYWYTVTLENGYTYQAAFYGDVSSWKGTYRDFVIATDVLKDGSTKHRISFLPTFEEIDKLDKVAQSKLYGKIKIKTENEIDKSSKTVGVYIYDTLLQNPKQKINGKLVRTIERKFYKDELKQILKKQMEFHTELQNGDLYNDCVRELYRNNDAHQLLLSKRDFLHLFMEDIIFYQRPLSSQKSSISNCSLEARTYKDKNGIAQTQALKVVPKSNPYYQEFRIWQWMYNLSIYKNEDDTNVTQEFFSSIVDWENLFEFLNDRKEIDQKTLIKYLLVQKGFKGKQLSASIELYRWNYVLDKSYPCNETKTLMKTRLAKVKDLSSFHLTREIEQSLWHLIYSVTDKIDYEKALASFANKHKLDEATFIDAYRRFPPFKSEYGSFSEKALKKLLPLMRIGKFWTWDAIDVNSKDRIGKIITGEYDENIKDRVREKAIHLTSENQFQGLQLWLAQYIVYGRHYEAASLNKWNSAEELASFLQAFKQHTLRNPIVEQVVTETLRVVKDIWIKYGNGAKGFFDEIHIELGREMKNTADERKRITSAVTENENTNLRIKSLLLELMNDSDIENVRPYSPIQQEILKIYEEGVLNSDIAVDDDILKISKMAQPSSAELKKYKLWLEQKYRSPYTGAIIPLNKLFTAAYEIEHIIPQSRFFDDSFNNKVICEAAVNRLKDNQIGLAFIKNFHGQIVECGFGHNVKIFEVEAYEDFVKQHYAKNRSKRNKLLLEDIPDKMIERQLNDTRYISKYISGVLSNIVREDKNDDGVNSKNVLPGNGKITTELKQDWGLNDVWNELILPRFERLNQITNTTHFTTWNANHQKFLPTVPLELAKGFSKKRIDHRHHAMDALVIACATRDHINLLNNKHAKSKERFDLNRKLRQFEKVAYNHPQTSERIVRDVPKTFLKPWSNFTIDAKRMLEGVIVSFKQNLRVINKATNHYEKWVEKDGVKTKEVHAQKGVNWAIRKPMHQETVSGIITLNRVKIPNGKILTATRKSLNSSFTPDRIESITDTGIQNILKKHLASNGNNPELAFSPEGIDEMNKNIKKLNGGKNHQPIFKFRVFEIGNRFLLGNKQNKSSKYVQSKEGTNLFYAVYKNDGTKIGRSFETIPFNEVIEHQKWRATLDSDTMKRTPLFPLNSQRGRFLFCLSPNDLVYIPTEEEIENDSKIDLLNLTLEQKYRLFLVNDFSSTCYFRPNHVAKAIAPKEVDMNFDVSKSKLTGSYDIKTASFDGKQIKDICIKLDVNRLGQIVVNNK